MKWIIRGLAALVLALMMVGVAAAAPPASPAAGTLEQTTLPASYHLTGIEHIWQQWNNCGPATLTMGLTYFGYNADQSPAATWLKPNSEDKNVSPWQIVEYVNNHLPGNTRALLRQGGDLTLLKTLISNNFPVMIEAGYEPPGENLGWMGHYLLGVGYDDAAQTLTTMDSYEGPNLGYSYDHINHYWRHFNRLYIVLYDIRREAEVMTLLGDDADELTNWNNALEDARAEAIASPEDPFAWFNMGTNFVGLGMYVEASVAYDQSRNVGGGLPWRMLWYQFGMFEAYLQVERYNDVIELAQRNLNDGGGQYVEETFYYGGLARLGMGETQRAIDNFNGAIAFNPNFTPARIALESINGG